MRKKVLCGALLAMMCLSMAACGKDETKDATTATQTEVSSVSETEAETETDVAEDVTAESLINGIDKSAHENQIMNSQMVIDVSMSMDKSFVDSLTEQENQNMNSDETSTDTVNAEDYKMTMGGTMDIEGTSKVAHITGDLTSTMMGQTDTQKTDSWTVEEEDGTISTYTYDETSSGWVKSTEDSTNAYKSSYFTDTLDASILEVMQLETTDAEYVITAKVDSSKINDALTSVASDVSGSDTATEGEAVTMLVDVAIHFDKATKEVTSISFDFTDAFSNAEQLQAFGMTVDKFVMTLNINGYSDGELTVPDEVLSAATNEDVTDVSGEDDTADDTTTPTSEEATETSEASTEAE